MNHIENWSHFVLVIVLAFLWSKLCAWFPASQSGLPAFELNDTEIL